MSPQSLGFLSRSCDQRLAFAGTYDQKWLGTQYPFLPLDFDDRYFQGAPPDQTCPHLQGGEKVRLINLTPSGILEFEVPRLFGGIVRRGESRLIQVGVVLERVGEQTVASPRVNVTLVAPSPREPEPQSAFERMPVPEFREFRMLKRLLCPREHAEPQLTPQETLRSPSYRKVGAGLRLGVPHQGE